MFGYSFRGKILVNCLI